MESPHELRERAERYRRMALSMTDGQAIDALKELAVEYDALAATLDAADRHGGLGCPEPIQSGLSVGVAGELSAFRRAWLCWMRRAVEALNAAISAANSAFEALRTAWAARIPPRIFFLSRLKPPGDGVLFILCAVSTALGA